MKAIVDRHLPQTGAEIRFNDGYPAMSPTPANTALVTVLNGINRDMGLPQMRVLDPSRRGAGDISFVAKYVASMAGLGTNGEGGHTSHETMDIPSFNTQVKRAALMIYRLTR